MKILVKRSILLGEATTPKTTWIPKTSVCRVVWAVAEDGPMPEDRHSVLLWKWAKEVVLVSGTVNAFWRRVVLFKTNLLPNCTTLLLLVVGRIYNPIKIGQNTDCLIACETNNPNQVLRAFLEVIIQVLLLFFFFSQAAKRSDEELWMGTILQVKISSDGVRMTRWTNSVLLSFSL